jgi:hypothetical protein
VFDLTVDPHSADNLVFGIGDNRVGYRIGHGEWGSVDLPMQASDVPKPRVPATGAAGARALGGTWAFALQVLVRATW